ncbi:MAG TPA: 3-isopropylmalate dehydratase small subunit [Myxococcales bacterium]|nr:3-isopropylmalate dehydratase small subunit [Myxococcales bacterium]
MTPFLTLESRTVVIPRDNIDTDQIIPARFLKGTTREGLGQHLFADRRAELGSDRGAQVLVAGANFGCGSSREHAPWALVDYGFRAVVSRSLADIFRANAIKNGLLPVIVDEAMHRRLLDAPGATVAIDLERCELRFDGAVARFAVDPFARRCLLDGTDELGFLLAQEPRIAAFEKERSAC